MESIKLVCGKDYSPAQIAATLGTAADDPHCNLSGQEITVPWQAVDTAIATRLRRNRQHVTTAPETPTEPALPERLDIAISLDPGSPAQVQAMQAKAQWIADTHAGIRNATKIYHGRLQVIRDGLVLAHAMQAIEGKTLAYGAHIPGARLVQLDGIPRRCNTLIHLTHPTSPEELFLREAQIECDRIYRYHVPGLDDAAWSHQNELLRWPPDARDLRTIAVAIATPALEVIDGELIP